MDAVCGICGEPAFVTIPLHIDDIVGTFSSCQLHVIETLATIGATVERFADDPYAKTIAALERKMHAGTANDADLTDLVRYRRLREDAKLRHPSGRTL
jgi:hypothetical protein